MRGGGRNRLVVFSRAGGVGGGGGRDDGHAPHLAREQGAGAWVCGAARLPRHPSRAHKAPRRGTLRGHRRAPHRAAALPLCRELSRRPFSSVGPINELAAEGTVSSPVEDHRHRLRRGSRRPAASIADVNVGGCISSPRENRETMRKMNHICYQAEYLLPLSDSFYQVEDR